MRLLVLTCWLGLLVGCGESQGSGADGGGAGLGGQASAGGKSAAGGQSGAGSSSEEAGTSGGGSGGRGGSSGVAGGGASAVGGGGAGAGASGAPSVSTGGMGMLSGACAGAFKAPAPQILLGQSPPSNLSITGDELELFFNSGSVIFSHRRASTGVLFPEATPVAELGGVCGAQVVGGMDVTLDGLRLYVACSDDAGGYTGPLRLATRANRESPFVLSPDELGTVGNSISISQDELTLYGVTQPGSMGYTLVYERPSLDDPFGPGQLVMGLGGPFSYPEISPDGLNLFGTTALAAEGLAVASRATPAGDFSAPTHTGFPAAAGGLLQFTPTVSQTCRLYYLNFGAGSVSNTVNLLPH